MSGFYYLASSYSRHPGGLEDAYLQAVRAAGLLLARGINVFSPIVHAHPIQTLTGTNGDHAFWLSIDNAFMQAARGIIVLRLNGWRESIGVAEEMKVFHLAGKPLVFMDPGRVPEELMAPTDRAREAKYG